MQQAAIHQPSCTLLAVGEDSWRDVQRQMQLLGHSNTSHTAARIAWNRPRYLGIVTAPWPQVKPVG